MMKELGSVIGTVAPTIAGAFGGPLASLAINAVTKALGLQEGATKENIEEAMAKANPEMFLKIKEAEQQFIKDMKSLEVDLEKIAAGDREDARETSKTTGDWTPKVIATVVLCSFVVTNFMLLMGYQVPDSSKDFFLRSLGTLDFAAASVLSFFLGKTHVYRKEE